MAHHNKFLSVNLNNSYGKPSSSSSLTSGYGNVRPRSAGGAGGMVVLSRPRSSSGTSVHKNSSKLAVPPPVNLPSLRKEHERLDPASSKPSSGHNGSGLGPGLGSIAGWTKPTLSSGEQRSSITGDARPQVFSEKAVILKGEDFPSLLATSASFSKQKQRQICENFDVWEDKADLSSAIDMRPQLRSSALIKSNAHGIQGGSGRAPFSTGQSRKDDATFPAALPLVRLRSASDWDDDERDRNHSFSAFDDRDGRLLLEGEPRSSLSRDSARDDIHGNREFTNSKKVDRDAAGSWRVTGQPNRDLSLPRLLHADRDLVGPRNSSVNKGTGKENSHSRSFGDRRDFSSVMGLANAEVVEASSEKAEFLSNWQRGKRSSSGLISKGHATSGSKSFLPNGPVSNFSKEKLISNVGKSFAVDANSDGKGPFSSDAPLDLNTKVYRKKKEAAVKPSDFFDPVRESFEAELERVQQQQELERQRAVEEQARAMQAARRESEERERRAREEEERRRLLEEEAREAAWRAEQEKLEASRRTEEQRIAIKEEKKRILIEEERRKEAARQLLLELEARIAKRQNEANTMDDRVKERDLSRDSDLAEWEKTKRTVETFTSTPSSGLSFVNRISDAGFRTQASNVESYSFSQKGMPESNLNQISSSTYKFPDQDGSYSSSRHDAFGSKRGLHWKQFQGTDEPLPIAPSYNKGMSAYQTESLQRWDRNGDCDQFNGSSNTDAASGAWNHGHFDGTQLAPFSHRSFQNAEVDLVSFNRVRHNLRQPRVPPPLSLLPSQCKSSFEATSEGPNASLLVNSGSLTNSASRKEESDLQIVYNCRYQQIGTESISNEFLEGTSSSLLQTEDKNSPRYDSQSSLSVSIPPSSPTQHSHDELDDCGGFSALTTSVEEENMTSDSKHMIPQMDSRHMDSEITFLSHEEDDEWAVDNDDEVQDGDHEVHDVYQKNNEVHDIYQENNEIHEGNLRNLRLANKIKGVDAVVEQSDAELRHSCYGTNVCVQLGASCHDVLNKDFDYAEKMSINQGSTTNAMVDLVHTTNSEDDLQSSDVFSDDVINTSYDEKMDKRQEDPIFGPIANVSHPLDGIGASEHSDINPMESESSLSLSSSLCSVSTSVPTNLDEVPVRLQFGLFSSPPLIPSPLPTIQIGSIQMPLPLHEQIDSYGQIHSSLPPLFQLGQINQYTPLISQSAVPTAGHTMSFIQPSALGHSYDDQNTGSSSSNLVSQDSSQPGFVEKGVYTSAENSDPERFATSLDVSRDEVHKSQSQITATASDEKNDAQILIPHSANHGVAPNKNFRFMVNPRRTRVRQHAENEPLSAIRKSEVVSKAPGTIPEVRGNRFAYNGRNNGSLPSLRRAENLFANSYRHQRRGRRHFQVAEYRIKEDGGTRQMQCFEYFSQGRPNEKPYYNNISADVSSRNSNRKDPISKSLKRTDEVGLGIQTVGTDSYLSRANKKEITLKKNTTAAGDFCGGVGSLKKNGVMDDDIDTHLRNGIVRIFNQPGIEASTDGDGFVEVRSKRKMSNERRGQRQKETNPKYKTVKVPRRNRSTNLNNVITPRSDMVADSAGGTVAKCADVATVIKRSQGVQDASLLPTTGIESRMIPPVDIVNVNFTDASANSKTSKSTHAGSDSDKTSDGTILIPNLFFGDTIIAHDKTSVPLGTWGTVHLNNQMITSTISQIDEASDPVGNNQLAVDKNSLDDSKRVVTQEKLLFSSSNQLNFPFTGEKIQFGAVAMPTTLPSSSQSVSSSIWPSGSVILNASIIHNIVPVNKHCQSSFFDKDKCSGESCTDLNDTEAEAEAEAEAAASAVAVAAISNDDISVSTLIANSTSDNGTKGTSAPGRSAMEQSLVVTLPADLSVDIPQSLWPHLPSTQSSRPMLSHIAGPQPSPFPFFDPNPILGGPIFAFRPQDESSGLQAQPQQTTTFSSVPTGTWSQCHSSVDSFYGSPAGFPAPFMSPPGGLSGVHGHPQMVFYNHFAPVGQFGHQVGLSYMGTTYIPTGKQPDWKHNSKAPAVNVVNKADHPSNLNVVYGQQKVAHITRASHLSSESAVNPAASPFPIFNHRPFKSSTTEASSVPAHWPPIPHSSPHSIRLSAVPGHPPSLPPKLSAANAEPRSAVVADLPDELALLDPTASNSRTVQPSRNPSSMISMSPNAIPSENMMTRHTTSPVQPQPLHPPIGKADQLKAATPKTSSTGEWRRRSAFPRKLRNIGATRMKQIYVPKSVSAGNAASS